MPKTDPPIHENIYYFMAWRDISNSGIVPDIKFGVKRKVEVRFPHVQFFYLSQLIAQQPLQDKIQV